MLLFSSAYNEYTVISKEYTGPLDFDITGVNCSINPITVGVHNNVTSCIKMLANRRTDTIIRIQPYILS